MQKRPHKLYAQGKHLAKIKYGTVPCNSNRHVQNKTSENLALSQLNKGRQNMHVIEKMLTPRNGAYLLIARFLQCQVAFFCNRHNFREFC